MISLSKRKEKSHGNVKHIAEEIHFSLKEFVLKFVQMSSIQRVNIERTKLAEDCYGWQRP